MDRIHDMHAVKIDSLHYLQRTLYKCLQVIQKEKNANIWRYAFSIDRIYHPLNAQLTTSLVISLTQKTVTIHQMLNVTTNKIFVLDEVGICWV